MQPIAINIDVISHLINNWSDAKSQRIFHRFAQNLEDFHNVYIDKTEMGSKWLAEFRKIRESITDYNVKQIFDNLIGPRRIHYIPIQVFQENEYIVQLAKQTPDKIGLSNNRQRIDDIEFFDLTVFNSIEYDLENILFRIPKPVNVPPGTVFKHICLLIPYIRDAKEIEFCDPFLFESAKFYESEVGIIFKILEQCKNLTKLKIHCKPNYLNISQRNFEKEVCRKFKHIDFQGYVSYNPPNKDVNHDRFIIVNKNEFSIRFTTSFNNLSLSDSGNFIAKDSFLIEFSRGRKYYD